MRIGVRPRILTTHSEAALVSCAFHEPHYWPARLAPALAGLPDFASSFGLLSSLGLRSSLGLSSPFPLLSAVALSPPPVFPSSPDLLSTLGLPSSLPGLADFDPPLQSLAYHPLPFS